MKLFFENFLTSYFPGYCLPGRKTAMITTATMQETGLGLSLSYDIVKPHGGEFNIRSVEADVSELIISLPF